MDHRTRWIELRIPVTEGPRYRVGSFEIAGNTVADAEKLEALFELREGDYYRLDSIRKGLEKAREIYGAAGYFEFTGFPDYRFQDDADPAEPARSGGPTVEVTMRLVEGVQYFVNRSR